MMHLEGYHEYRGGINRLLLSTSMVLNIPHGTHDILPHESRCPYGTEHLPSIQGIPHGTHDIPSRY